MKIAIIKLATVAFGGAIGAMLRYSMAAMSANWLGRDFPYHTLIVNVTGSLMIGYLLVWLPHHDDSSEFVRLAVMTGVLGGFTTFSAFSMETLVLLQDGDVGKALANIALTLILCLLAVWLGFNTGRWLHPAA